MTSHRKKSWIQLGTAATIIIALIIAFSLPIGNLPILGKLLFPGSGIWKVPGDISKTERLTVPSLSGDVDILRDQWGVPHIYGENESDCVFAIGYCHAQDRLFMMDMARRLTRGNLSEILGVEYLEVDQFNLLMLKDYWSIKTYEALKEQAITDLEARRILQVLEAYADGINYYVGHTTELPLEFQLLDYKMEPWTPVDSLCMAKYMSEMLTWGYEDFYRLLAMDALGDVNYTELLSNPQPFQIPICPNYGIFLDQPIVASSSEIPNSASSIPSDSDQKYINSIPNQVSQLCDIFLDALEQIPQEQRRMDTTALKGSNNWVVDGNKSATGKPILCNDMHLGWNLPGIWYEVQIVVLSEPEPMNLWGFTLPGFPFPLVGHNTDIGWGFTNTGYDVLDWYYYDGENATHYWYRGQHQPYDYMTYKISVRRQNPVEFVIKTTVHGPVFTEVLNRFNRTDYMNTQLACKWIAHNVTWEIKAFYGYAHAKNRAEFNTASSYFCTPAQNMIYADVYGNIGIRPTGKVPLRNDTGIPSWHVGHGFMPYNGSTGQGEWMDFVPFADLPHTENPDQNFLCSANQIVAGPAYLAEYQLQGFDYSAGYRARRINEWLKGHEDILPEDMQSLQFDRYGIDAGNFTPYLLATLEELSSNTTQQQAGYNLLRYWDFEMNKDLAAPTLFNAWLEIYKEMTFLDDFAAMNLTRLDFYISSAIMENLTKNDPTSKWFDNITTPAIEIRDDIIIAAFNLALSACEAYFGTSDVQSWIWGEIHQNYFEHLLGLEQFSYSPIPTDGTSDTVNPTYSDIWENGQLHLDINQGGASERVIMDFDDLNNTRSVIPSGQRGIPGSEHYTDQLKLYLEGQYHPTYFGFATVASFPNELIESKISITGGT